GVLERVDGPTERAGPGRVEELQGHQLNLPVQTGNTHAVVAHRADDPGDMAAVAVVVERIVGVGDEIPSNEVVDILVSVVRDAVGPAALADGLEEVGGGDAAVAVQIGDLARSVVDRILEVAEGDEA